MLHSYYQHVAMLLASAAASFTLPGFCRLTALATNCDSVKVNTQVLLCSSAKSNNEAEANKSECCSFLFLRAYKDGDKATKQPGLRHFWA